MGTVADVVYEAGVILGRDDEISPDRYLKAEDGMTIEVNRVKYREVTVTEEIPYETVEQKDDTMYVDARVVVTEGKTVPAPLRSVKRSWTASWRLLRRSAAP